MTFYHWDGRPTDRVMLIATAIVVPILILIALLWPVHQTAASQGAAYDEWVVGPNFHIYEFQTSRGDRCLLAITQWGFRSIALTCP